MKESEYFERVTKRLEKRQTTTEWVPFLRRNESGRPADLTGSSEWLTTFVEELEKLGAKPIVVDSIASLQSELKRLLVELNPDEVVTWSGETLEAFGVNGIIADVGHATRSSEEGVFRVGVTSCDFAVANTGSLVLCSGNGKPRAASLLPDAHIAILRSTKLRRDLGEVLRELDDENFRNELPSAIQFISGPSRSSDIENDQSIGVHGPGEVMVLILRERVGV